MDLSLVKSDHLEMMLQRASQGSEAERTFQTPFTKQILREIKLRANGGGLSEVDQVENLVKSVESFGTEGNTSGIVL